MNSVDGIQWVIPSSTGTTVSYVDFEMDILWTGKHQFFSVILHGDWTRATGSVIRFLVLYRFGPSRGEKTVVASHFHASESERKKRKRFCKAENIAEWVRTR